MSGVEFVPEWRLYLTDGKWSALHFEKHSVCYRVFPEPVAAALVEVEKAARHSIAEVAECSALHDALDVLDAARAQEASP